MKNNEPQIIWKGRAGDFNGWASAMEQTYGKDITLQDFITKMKLARFNIQVKYINDKYGYNNIKLKKEEKGMKKNSHQSSRSKSEGESNI